MTGTCKTFTKFYTMVELLVVLFVVGILLAISLGGLNGITKRQGAAGGVRNISSKLSLARSYAVVGNAYVALLMPNDNPTPPGPSFAFTTGFGANNDLKKYFFYSNSRLCVVMPSTTTVGAYTFCEWINGNEWEPLSSGTCAYISTSPTRVDGIPMSYNGSSFTASSSAIVFKPNGILVSDNDIKITIFIGQYVPTNPTAQSLVYETKSGQHNAWQIKVNAFTGKTSYEKQSN